MPRPPLTGVRSREAGWGTGFQEAGTGQLRTYLPEAGSGPSTSFRDTLLQIMPNVSNVSFIFSKLIFSVCHYRDRGGTRKGRMNQVWWMPWWGSQFAVGTKPRNPSGKAANIEQANSSRNFMSNQRLIVSQ